MTRSSTPKASSQQKPSGSTAHGKPRLEAHSARNAPGAKRKHSAQQETASASAPGAKRKHSAQQKTASTSAPGAQRNPAGQQSSVERRSYGQYCGLAHALDVIGERWTLLILRDLLLGPRRYGTLLEGLRGSEAGGGITTNLLAKRLRELEAAGLVQRALLRGASAYQLTPRGNALEPAIQELARWGGTHFMDGAAPGERMSLGWMLLNLKRKARPAARRVVLNVSSPDDEHFTLQLGPSGLEVSDQSTATPDGWLRGDLLSLHRVLFRADDIDALVAADLLSFEGDHSALAELLRHLERAASA